MRCFWDATDPLKEYGICAVWSCKSFKLSDDIFSRKESILRKSVFDKSSFVLRSCKSHQTDAQINAFIMQMLLSLNSQQSNNQMLVCIFHGKDKRFYFISTNLSVTFRSNSLSTWATEQLLISVAFQNGTCSDLPLSAWRWAGNWYDIMKICCCTSFT